MDFDFTEEQAMFQKAIKDFAEKEIAPLVDEAEEKEQMPVELFPKMGQLGYLCPRYPEELGGGGMGKIGDCIMFEELGRVCAGISGSIMVQGGIGSSAIHDHGTEKQKQDYLIPVIKGDKIAAFGLTEPNAGSDAASIETTAVKGGDSYVINGTKIFITNSPIADFIITAAYTDKSKGTKGGISLFIVDKGTPGLDVRKLHKVCFRAGAAGEVTLDDVRVPKENLVGEEGKGFRYLMETLTGGRIAHAAQSNGVSQAAYEASLEYAKTRSQFGKPIGKFQGIAFMVAKMAIDIEAARWLTYRAAWLQDQGMECRKEAAMSKLYASEICNQVAGDAMQVHGGYAFMLESPVQRYFRDARLRTVTEGTSEIQTMVISRELGL